MYELILIYKSRHEERMFPTKEDALNYLDILPRKPRYTILLDSKGVNIHFERR